VARNKRGRLSSGAMDSTTTADRAVDGNLNQNATLGSCMVSNLDNDHKLILDLGEEFYVDSIRIINRNDCCGEWWVLVKGILD